MASVARLHGAWISSKKSESSGSWRAILFCSYADITRQMIVSIFVTTTGIRKSICIITARSMRIGCVRLIVWERHKYRVARIHIITTVRVIVIH